MTTADDNPLIGERREKLQSLRAASPAFLNDFKPSQQAGRKASLATAQDGRFGSSDARKDVREHPHSTGSVSR